MQVKNGKFYADWREGKKRQRKAFATAREARKYQQEMRDAVRARKLRGIGSVGQETVLWERAASVAGKTPKDRWHERVVARDMIELAGSTQVSELDCYIPNTLIEKWKGKYSVAALYNLRFRLKNLCSWLELRGAQGLVKNLQRTPTPQPRHILFQPEEYQKLKEISPPWFRCFLLFCFDGGLRRGEAIRVAPINYSEETGKITIEVKKRRVQSFVVTDELKTVLGLAAKGSPEIPFMEALKGRRVTRSSVEQWFTKLKKRAGINPLLTTHDLRRTAATQLYNYLRQTGHADPIGAVQKFLGHANPITTLRYIVHADNLLLKPLVEQMKVAFTRRTASGAIERAAGI